MKRTLKATLIGTALLAASGAGVAIAGPGGCDMHGGKSGAERHGYMHALKQLDLSSEQQEKLRELIGAQRSQMKGQRTAMRENREALREAMQKNADEATIRKLAEAQGDAVTAMTLKRVEMKKQIDAILTPEQREKLAAMPRPEFDGRERHDKRRW